MVKVPGYTHVGNYHSGKKGGGISILLKDGITFKRRTDLDVFEEGKTESVFIEILSKNGRKIILGSMYRPPNTDTNQFSSNIISIVKKARSTNCNSQPEIIIGMDHNIDLLKGTHHTQTQKFIDELSELNLYPTITRPTHITNHSATLIDNIYISKQLQQNFKSAILLHDIYDHLPTLAMLKQTKLLNKEPLTFSSRNLNEHKLKEINH